MTFVGSYTSLITGKHCKISFSLTPDFLKVWPTAKVFIRKGRDA